MMELASMKCTLEIAFLFLVIQGICGIDGVDGATEVCGKHPSAMVNKVGPCAAAAQSRKVPVSRSCCDQVKSINKQCLCAIVLSNEAQILGIKPEVAVTIPKRCEFAHRPARHKCGAYTVP